MVLFNESRGGSNAPTLTQLIPHGKLHGNRNPRILTCTDNVHRMTEGDLFFAVVGATSDGHNDIPKAIKAGAVAIVSERLVVADIPVIVVDDCGKAFGRACHQLLGAPSDSLMTTAVAGSDGKTTVATLIEAVLAEAGKCVTSRTSLGVRAPAGYAERDVSPSPVELAGWLAKAVRWGAHDAIVEIDSRDAAAQQSYGAMFDHLVLTSANPAHLHLHRTRENYQRTLLELTDQLKPQGVIVANYDDSRIREQLQSVDVPALTYSLDNPTADIRASLIERHRSEQTFLIEAGQRTALVRTKIIGDQHIRNCLAATAVGILRGLELTQIAAGLERVERLAGRLDRVECGQPFSVFIEHHATPSRISAALTTLRSVTSGKVWCVFGPTATDEENELAAMGRIIERLGDHCVLTGATHQTRGSWPLVHDVLDGMQNVGRPRVIPTRERAIHWALDEASEFDTVLIVGAPNSTCPIEACGQRDDRPLVEDHLREVEDDEPTILPFPTIGR